MNHRAESTTDKVASEQASALEPLEAQPPAKTSDRQEGLEEFAAASAERIQRKMQLPVWELELLISGAVVFTLFQVPEVLDGAMNRTALHGTKDNFPLIFLVCIYLQVAVYTLIVSFLLHLAARAYWVGLIGLHGVFPQGIQWDKVKVGPRLKQVYRRRLADMPTLIERSGAFCAMIFSFSFSIVIVCIYSLVGVGLFGAISLFMARLLLPNLEPAIAFNLALAFFLVPYFALTLLDKLSSGLLRRIQFPSWFETILQKGIAFYSKIFGFSLYNSIHLVFASNMKQGVVLGLFYLILFGSLALTMSRPLESVGIFSLDGYEYFPHRGKTQVVQGRYYRDQAAQGGFSLDITPSIATDMIDQPYVKLFLPHRARQSDDLAELCPEVKPIKKSGLTFYSPNLGEQDPQQIEANLDCIASSYIIHLNGQPLDNLVFDFHILNPQEVRGLLTYIPVEDLTRGRHVLRIERLTMSEDGEIEKTPCRSCLYRIPFWI